MATTFNARAVWADLRAALDLYEAQLYGLQPGEVQPEFRLALAIVGAILPNLKGTLAILDATSGEWTAPRNRIGEKMQAAFETGQPLAGYAAEDWAIWGVMLQKLNAFLEEGFTTQYPDGSSETITPRQVINTTFTKAAVA